MSTVRSPKTSSANPGPSPSPSAPTAGILRSEIIWARPNPMPESVTDRPTKAHSTVFLLSKMPRYYFDHGGDSGAAQLAERTYERAQMDRL